MQAPDARNPREARVAAEQLVAADAGHGHLEAGLRGGLGHEVGVDAVDGGLIERAQPRRAPARATRRCRIGTLVVLGAVQRAPPRRASAASSSSGTSKPSFTVRIGAAVELREQPDQRRRVDAAREEGADRHVRHQVMPHRIDAARRAARVAPPASPIGAGAPNSSSSRQYARGPSTPRALTRSQLSGRQRADRRDRACAAARPSPRAGSVASPSGSRPPPSADARRSPAPRRRTTSRRRRRR